MRPTFRRRRLSLGVVGLGLCLLGSVLWAQGEKPAVANSGGDTLDTSTPAPTGIEAAPNPSVGPAAAAATEPEGLPPEIGIGGFIIPI